MRSFCLLSAVLGLALLVTGFSGDSDEALVRGECSASRGAVDHRWIFSQPCYTFDSTKIEITGGKIQLKDLGGSTYDTSEPTVVNHVGVIYGDLSGFTEVTGPGHAGTLQYQLSHDGSSWYYWNGSAWASASGFAQSVSAATVNANISKFPTDIGGGELYFKAFLDSDGTQKVEIDELRIQGDTCSPGMSCSGGGGTTGTCRISSSQSFAPGYRICSKNLLIQSGGAITSTGTISFDITENLTVESGANITANISEIKTGSLTVDTGGLISANTLGYAGGTSQGTGAGGGGGSGSTNSGGSGGGYGGVGGDARTTSGGLPYGSIQKPVEKGSGGGSGQGNTVGGAGGGAIKVNSRGAVTINGTVSAIGDNGAAGTSSSAVDGAGGGAGGSIWIIGTTLSGAGVISVAGGIGGADSVGNDYGAAGAGGRIALDLTEHSFTGTFTYSGGEISTYPVSSANGGTGTLYLTADDICDTGDLNGTCTVTTSRNLGNHFYLEGTGSMTVKSNATLTGSGIYKLANVTVDSGGTISANGTGEDPGSGEGDNGFGRGGGTGSSGASAAGGAYGGASGSGQNGSSAASTSTYGSNVGPFEFGSGGGAADGGAEGASGGGRLKFDLTGTLTNHGTLSADGATAIDAPVAGSSVDAGGGGSGGAIWIIANTMSGSGSVMARGGLGGDDSGGFAGGSGGGGRVAIDVTDYTYSGSIDVSSQIRNPTKGGERGEPGSIYLDPTNICDTGTTSGTCTMTTDRRLGDDYTLSGSGTLVVNSTVTLLGNVTYTIANITIDSGGTLSANELGGTGGTSDSIDGKGDSGGVSSTTGGGGGAAHAGRGGKGTGSTANTTTYGSATSPTANGSGGGSGDGGVPGGHGGGVVKVEIGGTLTLNGSITVDGGAGLAAGTSTSAFDAAGGGSGGSLWIVASTMTGSGTVSAKGGDGAPEIGNCGGAGGGGRISIDVSKYTYSGAVNIDGGSTGDNGTCEVGGRGSFDLDSTDICDTGTIATTCTITAQRRIGDDYVVTGAGDLVVNSGGTIIGNATYTVNDLTIDSGGTIQADELGDEGGSGEQDGFGTGTSSGVTTASGGAAHGGAGGNGVSGSGSSTTYGTAAAPVDLGSGAGGSDGGDRGGNGGGKIKMTVTNTLTVNGTLSANGEAGSAGAATSTYDAAGGGSGGSIYLIVDTLAGSGVIQVHGGAGGTDDGTNHGGGGGGGVLVLTTIH